MITPDSTGKIWNNGTKLGLIYMSIGVMFLITTQQDPDGPFAWLQKLDMVVPFAFLPVAVHVYAVGLRDAKNTTNAK